MRRILLCVGLAACGSVASTGTTAPDGGTADASTSTDAAPSPDANDATTPTFTPVSCDAGTDAGGACDPSRLRVVHRGVVGCFAVGQFCDAVMVSMPTSDVPKMPQGFSCGSELGVATCSWPIVNHMIDQAALDAACAVTQALPTANVDCIIYD